MKIVIISESASFPWGMAASSRVESIAKGLIHIGNTLCYVGLRGANIGDCTNDKTRSGCIDKIRYIYPGFFSVRSRSWILRRIDDFSGKWLSILQIAKFKYQKEIDLIILYTRNYRVVKFWSFWAKLLKIKIVLEICEWPSSYDDKQNNNSKRFCNKAPLLVDGVLPISEYIEKQIEDLAKKGSKKIPSYRIPILVDTSRFFRFREYRNDMNGNLFYSGSLAYKNIIMLILNTMILLKNRGYTNKLVITGYCSKPDMLYFKSYIDKHNIKEMIEFTGFLDENTFLEKMCESSVLLAPVPNDGQTEARFPTKLGFYLASGKPVITNPYGEIKRYLKDNEHAFFISGFEPELLKEKIIFLLDSMEICKSIGKNGMMLALKEFDVRSNFKDFDDFVYQL